MKKDEPTPERCLGAHGYLYALLASAGKENEPVAKSIKRKMDKLQKEVEKK